MLTMNPISKLQQQRREEINRQKRNIISKIDAKDRRMFGVITQFAAELVWQYVDGLCDAMASSKEGFKLQCRRLRDLRRSFNAKRNQILVNEDEQHLINLAELYQDCFDQQINKLVLNVNLYYKHLPLSERLLAVGLEQTIITYQAVEQFMEYCKDVLEQKCGKRFPRLTHDEFYQIPLIVEPMLLGKEFDSRTSFRNVIINILKTIVDQPDE